MMDNKISKWKGINWKHVNSKLKLLQAVLYKALIDGASNSEVRKIHNRILNSFAARAYAIRKITTSKGRKTPGIDGIIYATDEQKYNAVTELKLFNSHTYRAKSVKRVWIPKANSSKMKPLGIPTMYDRSIQTLYSFILDVHQEHNADIRSFGFRIGRSAKQAISYAWLLASNKKRFIMTVDVTKAYDSVSHNWILSIIPINRLVLLQWLKAGVLEKGNLTVDDKGVPQGGPISPIIFNMVMNGLENTIFATNKDVFPIRFADDITVFGNAIEEVVEMKEVIINFLKPRGMALNEEKTNIAEVQDGINFLGYNIREYPDKTRIGRLGKPWKKGILLIKPSTKAKLNFKAKIREVFRKYKKSSAYVLIMKLNPIIRGWANYFNAGGGWTETKNELGFWMWTKLKQWTYNKHKQLGRRTALNLYFKGVYRKPSYFNKWTFYGTKNGVEILLTDIQSIETDSENTLPFKDSPNSYNPADYDKVDKRLKRQAKKDLRLSKLKQNLLRKQDGMCPLCDVVIDLKTEAVERDHIIPKFEGGKDIFKNTALVHKTCHDRKTALERKMRAHAKKIGKLEKRAKSVKD